MEISKGKVDKNFWVGKKVFLTGHTGFKGSWMSLWLQSMGATVKGYSLKPNTSPNLFTAASVDTAMESEIGDIRDLKQTIEDWKNSPDSVSFFNQVKADGYSVDEEKWGGDDGEEMKKLLEEAEDYLKNLEERI